MASNESRYRILRAHASGGIGEVFVAEDLELHREVAVKAIRPELADDPSSRARFVLEAEITGRLEHPGIVPVYGFGQHEEGRPFYAMRFIQGSTLEEAVDWFHQQHAAKNAFDSVAFRKLLDHFVQACFAIEYAHSRGVLHRDLKPSNIMLGKYGETLVVDWGLAKAQQREEHFRLADERTLVPKSGKDTTATQVGRAMGTPAFMSPEQASGRIDEIGPQSDVYCLGATLYYILTGQMPFAGDTIGIVLRRIQEGEFSPPRAILRLVPKALEAICLKAMAPRLPERYHSAQALADDVQRYLADEMVEAYAEPVSQQFRRSLRRHPGLVAAATAALFVGIGSAAAIASVVSAKNRLLAVANSELQTASLAERDARQIAEAKRQETELARQQEESARLRAETAERAAVANQRRAEEQQRRAEQERSRAEREQQISQSVKDFLQTSLLKQADPWTQAESLVSSGGGSSDVSENPTIRELLDRASQQLTPEQIESKFPQMPLVQAEILRTLGTTYRDIGEFASAIRHLERSRELATPSGSAGDDDALLTTRELAVAYRFSGKVSEATALLEDVRKQCLARFGPDHSETWNTLYELGWTYLHGGKLADAIGVFEQLRDQRSPLAGDDSRVLAMLHGLSMAYLDAGRLPDAIQLLEQVRDKKVAALGPHHPSTLTTLNGLAVAYRNAGRLDEAISLFEQVRDRKTKHLGADHPSTLTTVQGLAIAYRHVQRLPEATQLLEAVRDKRLQKLGKDHPDTLTTMNELAITYLAADRAADAQRLLADMFPTARRVFGPDHAWTQAIARNWCQSLDAVGSFEKADEIRRELKIERQEF
jgi:serine/threonine protein kinase